MSTPEAAGRFATRGKSAIENSSIYNPHDLPTHALRFDVQPSDGDGQLEPAGPRTARVEVKHSTPRFHFRNMAVPVDHDPKSRSFRLEIELR